MKFNKGFCKNDIFCKASYKKIKAGSGFGKGKTALSKETLGVPVIAIGSPTVTRLSDSDFVSPGDIDILVRRTAKLISAAVDLAVFPEAGMDFIKGIIL